jgi:flagellin
MIQVADGAASEITDMLQRMRELTVQSSNGVNSTTDRANLDQEFVQLALAIDKIAETTEFNGRKILNGDADGSGDSIVTFQVGANSGANEQLDVDFSDFNLKNGVSAVTETFTDANINDAFVDAMNPSGDVTLTDNLGNTITLTAAAVTSATSAGGLATLINDASGAFNMTATGTDAGGLVLKSDSAGPGTQAAALTYTGTGTPALTEVSGVNATPMTADLSAFSTTGINESDFADTLNKLDAALEGVASQRATFGAAVNTLEHTVDNLVTTSGNQSAARSQILDADYAAETTALARTQIISQAGTAMLSQANQAAQGVLALLR